MLNKIMVGCLIATALLLRVYGVDFGAYYHADEPIVVNHALAYASGDLNPNFFAIPPLVSYLCFGLFGFLFVVLKALGAVAGVEAFEALFFRRPEIFFVLGRAAVGVIPGVITVILVRSLFKKITDSSTGTWAAWALAVNYLHARDSHIIYTDILMSLWVWLAVFASVQYLRKPGVSGAVWIGVWTGLAAATKYNAVLVGVSGFVAWLIASRRWKELAIMAGVSVAVFAALNPFAILDLRHFAADLAHQATAESAVGFHHTLTYSLAESCGGAVLLIALAGAVLLFKKDLRMAAVFLAFPALFFIKLTVFSQPHERYVMPLLPFVAACFGYGASVVLARARERKIRRAIPTFILSAALAFGAVKTVYADVLFGRADTRDLARAWIEKNLAPGSGVAFTDPRQRPLLWRDAAQWGGPGGQGNSVSTHRRTAASLIDRKNAALRRESVNHKGYYLYFVSTLQDSPFSSVWPLVPPDLGKMRAEGVRYVILHYGNDPVPGDLEAALKAQAKRVIRFSPYHDESRNRSLEPWGVTFAAYAWRELSSRTRFGPVLEIYEL